MADFQSAANYLKNTDVDLVTSTTIDVGTGEVEARTTSFSLREIICSLLAGNGILLPNLQLCLKINIGGNSRERRFGYFEMCFICLLSLFFVKLVQYFSVMSINRLDKWKRLLKLLRVF